jgi:putative N-acetylmannosamine-6-phosphate epimerase
MNSISELCSSLQGKLIVSCQASAGDAFRDTAAMARFARAAVNGGAAGIRAAVTVPIIGIRKSVAADGRILITPSLESARELVAAGADLIALDCTARGQQYGALERLRQIKAELCVPVLADIATVEEAVGAAEAGADFVLSTMRGYTAETEQYKTFEPEFIAALRRAVNVPIIAEGRIWTPDEACAAMAAGAYAVIVGTAITRPHEITRRFVNAVESAARQPTATQYFIGIDLLGTGVGGGMYLGGQLHQGAHFVANAIGHMQIEADGLPCTCGKRGCLEVYANAAALLRHAMGGFNCAADIIGAAGAGDRLALHAIRTFARYLARGCAVAIHLLDPALLIFAGGLTQNNPALLEALKRELTRAMLAPGLRRLEIRFSQLGYEAGVIGAAAFARERFSIYQTKGNANSCH